MAHQKRIKRYGDYRGMPKQLLMRCARIFCTVCNTHYGELRVARNVFLHVEQCLDHIWPVRFLLSLNLDPHQEVNIVSVCGTCHGKKLKHEDKIFAGNTAGFLEGLNKIGYPMDRVYEAGKHYGFTEAAKFISRAQAEKEFLDLTSET